MNSKRKSLTILIIILIAVLIFGGFYFAYRKGLIFSSADVLDENNNDLTFSFSDYWQGDQLVQLKNTVETDYQKIKELYGPPAFTKNITFDYEVSPRGDSATGDGRYDSLQNKIFLSAKKDADLGIKSDTNSTIIHEMAHAFHDKYSPSVGWEEGMAKTVEEIINARISTGREDPMNFGAEIEYDAKNFPREQFSTQNYSLGMVPFGKLYIEDKNIFKKFNEKYYQLRKTSSVENWYSQKEIALFNVISTVENEPIELWYAKQHILYQTDTNSIAPINGYISHLNPAPFEETIALYIVASKNTGQVVNIKLYDFQNRYIGEKNIFFNGRYNDSGKQYYQTIGIEDIPGYADFTNINQRIKIVIESQGSVAEIYGYNIPFSQRIYKFFGTVNGIDQGTIIAKSLSQPSSPELIGEIKNGLFSMGDISEGKYKFTISGDNKTCERTINKGFTNYLGYYGFFNCHTESEYQDVIDAINKKKVSQQGDKITVNYKLPQKFTNYVRFFSKGIDYYSESSKTFSDSNSYTTSLPNIQSKLPIDYTDILVFAPDGYVIGKENNFIEPTPTPTETTTTSTTSSTPITTSTSATSTTPTETSTASTTVSTSATATITASTTASSSPTPTPNTSCKLTGTVQNQDTQGYISNAKITLGDNEVTATTNASGIYEIDDLASRIDPEEFGGIKIIITADGFYSSNSQLNDLRTVCNSGNGLAIYNFPLMPVVAPPLLPQPNPTPTPTPTSSTTTTTTSAATTSTSTPTFSSATTTLTAYKYSLNSAEEIKKMDLAKGEKAQFQLYVSADTWHELQILNINSQYAQIQINSTPVVFNLGLNETKYIDVDGDGKYDVRIKLDSIDSDQNWVSLTYEQLIAVVANNNIMPGQEITIDVPGFDNGESVTVIVKDPNNGNVLVSQATTVQDDKVKVQIPGNAPAGEKNVEVKSNVVPNKLVSTGIDITSVKNYWPWIALGIILATILIIMFSKRKVI